MMLLRVCFELCGAVAAGKLRDLLMALVDIIVGKFVRMNCLGGLLGKVM